METLQRVAAQLGLGKAPTTVGVGGKTLAESKEEQQWTVESIRARELALQKERQLLPHTTAPLACTPEYYVKFEDRVMLATEWKTAKTMIMTPRLVRAGQQPTDLHTHACMRCDRPRALFACAHALMRAVSCCLMCRVLPLVTDPGDAVVKVTSTTICGSDLHMSDTTQHNT
jgi:hypothetical protein